MAFSKILSSNPILQGRVFTKIPSSTGYNAFTITNSSQILDLAGTSGRVDMAGSSINFGTGQSVDSTGVVLFENTTNGGALSSILIANRAGENAYIGFNKGNPAVGSGFMIASGESIQFENTLITKVWAISTTGFSTIQANGLFHTDRIKV